MEKMFRPGDKIKIIADCPCCKGFHGTVISVVSASSYSNARLYTIELDDGRKDIYDVTQLELLETACVQEEYIGEW